MKHKLNIDQRNSTPVIALVIFIKNTDKNTICIRDIYEVRNLKVYFHCKYTFDNTILISSIDYRNNISAIIRIIIFYTLTVTNNDGQVAVFQMGLFDFFRYKHPRLKFNRP